MSEIDEWGASCQAERQPELLRYDFDMRSGQSAPGSSGAAPPLRRGVLLAALACTAASVGTAGDSSVVRITRPSPDEILYGRTRIAAEATADSGVAQVLFYLEPVPRPICNDREVPFTCEFDAGTEFQGRTIRVRALDERGRFLGAAAVETYAYPKPERVVQRVIQVPVVAADQDGNPLDLGQNELECVYGSKPCEVLGFEPIVDKKTLPLSILVLVDVSPSVNANRDEVLEAINAIIDFFPDRGAVAVAEFARHYQRLGPFTTDRFELRRQMDRLAINVPYTCLLRALDHALDNLGAREGHRALFVVSDGEETCDSRITGGSHSSHFQTSAAMLAHIVELSRSVAVPIYIYRLKEFTASPVRFSADRSYEGLARETGGRLFATGDLYGIGRSFGDLIVDLSTTWMLDIALPASVPPGRPRRLELEVIGVDAARLRHPEYWDPDSTELSRIGFLDSESAETRYWAARSLENSLNPDALRRLLAAARRETHDTARIAQLDAILAIAAAFLLHGDEQDQRTALDAVESLEKIAPDALQPLQPALAVYRKTDAPERLKKKASAFLAETRSRIAE